MVEVPPEIHARHLKLVEFLTRELPQNLIPDYLADSWRILPARPPISLFHPWSLGGVRFGAGCIVFESVQVSIAHASGAFLDAWISTDFRNKGRTLYADTRHARLMPKMALENLKQIQAQQPFLCPRCCGKLDTY